MKLFLCGDVMTGRGIDQILPHPCAPVLYERYMSSAVDYVALAIERSGRIPRPVTVDYIWGDALTELEARSPDFRIANLETAITDRGRPEPKGINYRMNPRNTGCLTAAKLDCCMLANNHTGDWGTEGLADTLVALSGAGIAVTGAGRSLDEASRPVVLGPDAGERLVIFAYTCQSSGTPASWAAGPNTPGVNYIPDISAVSAGRVAKFVASRTDGAAVVAVSVHWGKNWGYDIPEEHRRFAHALIDSGVVDLVYGHSSHHPKAIEVYKNRAIFYGCGDFINDYEGIRGHEEYRPELVLGYFLEIGRLGKGVKRLEMVPFRLKKLRVNRASRQEAKWLEERMRGECDRFGHRILCGDDGALTLVA